MICYKGILIWWIACCYGFVLCLDTKNQKSSQQGGFFKAYGLRRKTVRTWAQGFTPLLRHTLPTLQVKPYIACCRTCRALL